MVNTKTKILVVDDDPQNIEIVTEILSYQEYYDFQSVMSAEEALKIIDDYMPEIILLDIKMPGMNGLELCRCIRLKKTHRFVKIIMVSSMSELEDRLEGYSAGADDYVTKPYSADELFEKIEVYSRLRRTEEVEEMKTTALNILCHETRTPLNSILMSCDLMSNISGLNPGCEDYLQVIAASVEKIEHLIKKISRYSNVKDGPALHKTRGSLSGAIESVLTEFSIFDEVLEFSCDESITLQADWQYFNEVLAILIENALQHSPGDERVEIICQELDDHSVIIAVLDRGPGVDPSLQDKIFEGLFLPDLQHHKSGSGLSLAIAKEIVALHGGTIRSKSRKGGGANFEIIIRADM